MKRQDYYPGGLDEQALWLRAFAVELPKHARELHLDSATVADATADALWVAYTVGPWRTSVRAFARAATAAMESVQTGAASKPGELPVFTVPALDGASPRPPAGSPTSTPPSGTACA